MVHPSYIFINGGVAVSLSTNPMNQGPVAEAVFFCEI